MRRLKATHWFKSSISDLQRDVAVNTFIVSPIVPRFIRWRLLRAWGVNIERSAIAGRGFFGGKDLTIGRNSFVNYDVFFDTSAPISIGENCRVGMGVYFITGSHEIGPSERRGGLLITGAIVVEYGVWIGARTTILPGVTIGSGCVIGAGSLVTSDCAPDGVYYGVPAKRQRNLAV